MARLHRGVRPLQIQSGPVVVQPKKHSYPIPQRLFLAYHFYPVRAAMTRYHVRRLRQHLGRFERVRMCVAVDDRTFGHGEVRKMFGSDADRIEWMEITNGKMRDTAAHGELIAPFVSNDPEAAVLWAHGKGCSRHDEVMEWVWAEAMYRRCLDDSGWQDALRNHAVAGPCLWDRPVRFQDGSSTAWHFAGSFYWMRSASLAEREWAIRPHGNWHAEAFPGLVFRREEAYGLGAPMQIRPRNTTAHYPLLETIGTKLDIGGGAKPKNGHINVDRCEGATVRVELDGRRLPFADDSVDAIYSSHCLEHLHDLVGILREMVRVCRLGATIDLRLPHWLSPMAMCHGHVQVIPLEQIKHWCESAVTYWLGDSPKRLALVGHHDAAAPGGIELARKAFPALSDAELMRIVPGAGHESVFQLLVWQP